MSKHTPGPWRYKPHSVDGNYMLIFCSDDSSEGDNLRGYCGEANARLIAAAPDLLGALKAAEQAMSNEIFASEVLASDSVVREMIRAAINKATGDDE